MTNDLVPVHARFITILLAVPEALIRQAIRASLEREVDLRVVGETEEKEQTITEIERVRPDVVFLSEQLSDVETIARINARVSDCRIVVLADTEDELLLFQSIAAGTSAYLTNASRVVHLAYTARAVRCGNKVVPSRMLGALLDMLMQRWDTRADACDCRSASPEAGGKVFALHAPRRTFPSVKSGRTPSVPAFE